jgi:hypothetical protein
MLLLAFPFFPGSLRPATRRPANDAVGTPLKVDSNRAVLPDGQRPPPASPLLPANPG